MNVGSTRSEPAIVARPIEMDAENMVNRCDQGKAGSRAKPALDAPRMTPTFLESSCQPA